MELLVEDGMNKVVVTVREQKMLSQLMMKKSFEVIKSTGKYIKGLIDYEDLIFDFSE